MEKNVTLFSVFAFYTKSLLEFAKKNKNKKKTTKNPTQTTKKNPKHIEFE